MNFSAMMNSTMTVQSFLGNDRHGRKILSEPRLIRCRYINRPVAFRDEAGVSVSSEAVVWIAGDAKMNVEDYVILPDGSNTPIINIEKNTDMSGKIHNTKIYFSRYRRT